MLPFYKLQRVAPLYDEDTMLTRNRLKVSLKKAPILFLIVSMAYNFVKLPQSIRTFKKRNKHFIQRALDNFSLEKIIRNSSEFPSSKLSQPERLKPHLLIIRTYYRVLDQSKKEIAFEGNVFGKSLFECGLATFDEFFYDEDYQKVDFPNGDLNLIRKCLDVTPDMIILVSYEQNNLNQPRVKTLKYLGFNLGIPIIPFWYDAVPSKEFYNKTVQPLNFFTRANVFIDCFHEEKENNLNLWGPHDTKVLNDPGLKRVIPISFLGSSNSYRVVRQDYIESLINRGIDVHTGGGTGEERLTLKEYTHVFKKSQLSLNFSFSTRNTHQIKGRVFEVMLCGALLLESENDEITRFYTPYEDYVPFSDKDDLFEKVEYYLSHKEEREKIAERGKMKTKMLYNNKILWQNVLRKLP